MVCLKSDQNRSKRKGATFANKIRLENVKIYHNKMITGFRKKNSLYIFLSEIMIKFVTFPDG